MRSGVEQDPGRGQARLVPQADGYAEYVDPSAPGASRPAGPGQHRSSARRAPGQAPSHGLPSHGLQPRSIQTGSFKINGVPASPRRGQRTIRATITWLLILPVVTMIVLYIYALSGTIGPALAKQNAATVNDDMGQTNASLVLALDSEEADAVTYVASFHRGIPSSKLAADIAASNAAQAAFEAGAARARGALPAAALAPLAALEGKLATLPAIRQKAQEPTFIGPADMVTIFGDYQVVQGSFFTFSTELSNPNASHQEVLESQALIDAGDATADMSGAATLLGGILAGGGTMTPAEYRTFQQLFWTQQASFAAANTPSYWQVSPDPYWTSVNGNPPAMETPQVKAVIALEEKVLGEGSNSKAVQIGVSPAQLQQAVGGALNPGPRNIGPLILAEEEGRIGVTANDNHQGSVILLRLAAVGAGGLLVVILSTLLLLRFGARISRELTGLRNAAQTLSGERLPSVVRRLRAGDDVDVAAEAPPLDLRTRTREVTETADAFSVVQHTAIDAAVEQATLRKSVSNVFRSLARRNQSLVQRQLRMLDEMERGTQDPDQLSQLFRLDHLTTRMRRQAEGLIILSGAAPGRRWRQPVPIVEVLRGAISEIEEYVRVDLVTDSPDYLTGAAVADVTHLLAELIENAVVYSPPATRVQVRGGRVANGYVIEVEDRGLGVPLATRDQLNERLANPPDFDLTDSDQLGLFVVSRLAIRNSIKVSLRESGFGGTTAIVLVPGALVVTEAEAKIQAQQGAPRGAIGTGAAIGSGGRPVDADGHSPVPSWGASPMDDPATGADDAQDAGYGGRYGNAPFGAGSSGSAPFGNGAYTGSSYNTSSSYTTGSYDGSLGGTLPSRGGGTPGGGTPGGGSLPVRGGGSSGGGPLPVRGSGTSGGGTGFGGGTAFGGGAASGGGTGSGGTAFGGTAFGGAFGGGQPSDGGPSAGGPLPVRGSGSSGGSSSGGSSSGGTAFGGGAFGGTAFGSGPASDHGTFGGGPASSGGGTLPVRGSGGRGAFGNPAPFQDLPSAGGGRGAFGNPAPFQDAPSAGSPFAAAGDGSGQSEGVAGGGLPKRQKMASLAPQLRDNRAEAPKAPLAGRSPEQARALLSSIQRGLRTGREESEADDGQGGQDGTGAASDGRDAR